MFTKTAVLRQVRWGDALDALSPGGRIARSGRSDLWLADALPAGSGSDEVAREVLNAADLNIRRGTFAPWPGGYGRYDEARALGERAVAETADQLPGNVFASNSAVDAWLGLGFAHAAQGRPTPAREAFAHAASLYRALGHHGLEVSSLCRAFEMVVLVYARPRHMIRALP